MYGDKTKTSSKLTEQFNLTKSNYPAHRCDFTKSHIFQPNVAILLQILAIVIRCRLSVCRLLSVTKVYCDETAQAVTGNKK